MTALVVLLVLLFPVAAVRAQQADEARRDCASADTDRSIAGCTRMLQRGGTESVADRADAFINRGNAYSGKGDLDRAIADFSEAIRLNPRHAVAFYNRGVAYYR
jgi:tetratricopeptide (TPR) repeat protein